MGLTPKMLECRKLIAAGIDKGLPPSCAEIKDALGLNSVGAAIRLLERLEARGHIRRIKGKARAIELLNHRRTICCPNCDHEFDPATRTRGVSLGGETAGMTAAVEGSRSERAA